MLRYLALLALLVTLDASAARPAARAPQWTTLRSNSAVTLFIDKTSVRRRGDQVSLRYLVDFARPQGDFKTGLYRSLATYATVRCKARTISLGKSEAFTGPTGRGTSLGVAPASLDDMRFRPLEPGSSDEELWAFACGKAPSKRS